MKCEPQNLSIFFQYRLSSNSCPQQNSYICQKNPRRPLGRRKSFDLKICRKSAEELNENQKNKCLRLVGGYGGVFFQNVPAPMSKSNIWVISNFNNGAWVKYKFWI